MLSPPSSLPSLFLRPPTPCFPSQAMPSWSLKSSSLCHPDLAGLLGNWASGRTPWQGTWPQHKEGDAGPWLSPGWGWGFPVLRWILLPGQPGASCDPHVPGTGLGEGREVPRWR